MPGNYDHNEKLPPEEAEVELAVRRLQTERKRRGLVFVLLGVVLAALVILGALMWWELHELHEYFDDNCDRLSSGTVVCQDSR